MFFWVDRSNLERQTTTEWLWQVYAQLERDKVERVGAQRILTDLIALMRRALRLADELVSYREREQRVTTTSCG